MKTPLYAVKITCSDCGSSNTLEEINSDQCRYHDEFNRCCRFPKDGVTEDQVKRIASTAWLCECCQEDKEDKERD